MSKQKSQQIQDTRQWCRLKRRCQSVNQLISDVEDLLEHLEKMKVAASAAAEAAESLVDAHTDNFDNILTKRQAIRDHRFDVDNKREVLDAHGITLDDKLLAICSLASQVS